MLKNSKLFKIKKKAFGVSLKCLKHAPKEGRFFRNPKLPPLGVESDDIYIFLSACPTDLTYQIFVMIGPVFLEKKMLNGRRMTDDDGRQLIAKRHLSKSFKRILHP